jgi:hypothetical protein
MIATAQTATNVATIINSPASISSQVDARYAAHEAANATTPPSTVTRSRFIGAALMRDLAEKRGALRDVKRSGSVWLRHLLSESPVSQAPQRRQQPELLRPPVGVGLGGGLAGVQEACLVRAIGTTFVAGSHASGMTGRGAAPIRQP